MYVEQGIEGLQLKYKGSRSYLDATQTQTVINWLKQKNYWHLEELKEYIEDEWKVTCIRFAPNDPTQNPVEDIWLYAKKFVRKFYHSIFKVQTKNFNRMVITSTCKKIINWDDRNCCDRFGMRIKSE